MTRDQGYTISNSSVADLDLIFSFFEAAIEYQRGHGYDLWPVFGRDLIQQEIREGRHWKIKDGEEVVCVFSVCYNDPVIWQELDRDPAVYLHRIAVNPRFKGRKLMEIIRDWAIRHAREKAKLFVRMDTWGYNKNLRDYYIRCGFNYIGQQKLDEGKGAKHYGGPVLSLFQITAI